VLTYNVAGLPQGLSGSNPQVNSAQISPLLNDYDLVLVQEDFWYHMAIASLTTHRHASNPMWPWPSFDKMGDGLSRFSDFVFTAHERIGWEVCHGQLDHGSDCLTTKGLSFARHEVVDGVYVDVYNFHLDAGSAAEDQEARHAQVEQLLREVQSRSVGQAVILAGDTNLKVDREDRPLDAIVFEHLLEEAALSDACRILDCGQEQIDRVLFRSSEALLLTPTSWTHPTGFVDDVGEDLSDHLPLAVELSWANLAADRL